jgi:hypothetical protein
MKRRILLAAALGLVLALALVLIFFNAIVRWSMTPGAGFDPAAAPRAPDYESPAAWTALPGRSASADVALPSLPAIDPAAAPADVFYVHPTTYVGGKWNGPIDDPALNAATDRVATRLQASAFNACCAVYGPRYRQANGTAFTRPTDESERAVDLAYRDVAAAFRHFLERYSRGRPFILAAHSQGTVLARRLLREEIAGKPAAARLVAAYLIGAPVSLDLLAQLGLPACASPEQTGCVVAWNARGPAYKPGDFELRERGPAQPPGSQLCVNPLSWKKDDAAADASLNEGALFWEEDPPVLRPGFASAQCKDGVLVVSHLGKAPRDFMSRLLDRALGPGNYHPIEYQIFFANIRRNTQARVAAFVKR